MSDLTVTDIPSARQKQILDWLQEAEMLAIDDLVSRLGVSAMTVHRDLDALVRAGQAVKVHGGVRTAPLRAPGERMQLECAMCHNPVTERTVFVLHTRSGAVLHACCPHCGLMLMGQTPDLALALAKDFIYGRMVNCLQAVFLAESSISLCCIPSVLCFSCEDDARRFQAGFGGRIMDCVEARDYLGHHHHHHHHPSHT
ncbi:MAG: DeoR/GlpR transcriptional regulator [Anaerolineae bacterium]|nr:DeoR/GlpR transcriptional regulator [Anaerolineae bacterium]